MKICLSILLSLVLFSCSNTEKSAILTETTAKIEKEKLLINDSISKQIPEEKMAVDTSQYIKGKAVYNTSYCNGAAPSKEMLAEHRKEKPLKNSIILLKSKSGKEFEIKTDSNGDFVITVETKGEFDYYLTKKIDTAIGANTKCDAVFSKKYGTIKMPETPYGNIHLLYHFNCDPCDPYSKMRP